MNTAANSKTENSETSVMQLYTDKAGICDYLLEAYLTACEEQNPGITERMAAATSKEMAELLAVRFKLPFGTVPSVIRRIASVFAAYQIVQAITSLVSTEAASENEWLPLQKQWQACRELLNDIINGKVKLPAEENIPVLLDREEPSFAVLSPKRTFDLRGF